MKQVVLVAVWLLICIPTFVLAQSNGPVAEWSFNETSGQVAHDSVSGTDDAIGGLFKRVTGVSGNGLRFDGESTVITRGHKVSHKRLPGSQWMPGLQSTLIHGTGFRSWSIDEKNKRVTLLESILSAT